MLHKNAKQKKLGNFNIIYIANTDLWSLEAEPNYGQLLFIYRY